MELAIIHVKKNEEKIEVLQNIVDYHYKTFYFMFDETIMLWKDSKTTEVINGRLYLETISEVACGFDQNLYFVRFLTF